MSETAEPCDTTEYENTDRHLWPETSPVDALEEKLFVTSAGGIGINIGGHVIVRPLREWHRLAASQPDREALKEFIVSASFASRAALDSDTIFCEIYTPGYQPAKKGSFGFFVKELRAILSLLSGAGTKSDGGGQTIKRHHYSPSTLHMGDCSICGNVYDAPLHIGSPADHAASHSAGRKPGPSDAKLAIAVSALEFVRDGYGDQDVNHVDYRVRVYEVALDALAQLTKTPSADHDAGNLRGLAEPTPRDSSESTTGGAAPDHTTMEER